MESLEYFRSSTRWSLNWHPLFFQNWFKGHWDTLPEPPSIGRSKQWFSSKFDFNQTIEFSWSSFLVMITNPISAGIPQARKCGSLWIARVKWCEIPSFAGNYTILYQVFAFEYPQFCNVLLWNLHHVIYLINFHSPPPVAIQRLHLRVLPGNLGVDSDVPSAMWKCYEMLWNADNIRHQNSSNIIGIGIRGNVAMATRLTNVLNHCTLVKQNLFWSPNFLPVLRSGSPNVSWYNPYTIHLQYESYDFCVNT